MIVMVCDDKNSNESSNNDSNNKCSTATTDNHEN